MKLHYISGSLIPSTMANSVHVMKMCQAFAKRGHEVKLFGNKGHNIEQDINEYYMVDKNFKLILSPKSGLTRLWFFLKNRGEPDFFYGRDALCLWLISIFTKKPCYFEAHEIYQNPIRLLITKMLLKKSKKIVVISEGLKKSVLDHYSFLKNNDVLVAHDGADLWHNDPSTPKNWQNDPSTFHVGYAGSLVKGKGVENILEIAKLCPDMSFHIMGGKPTQIEALKTKCPENIFMHGHQPQEELKLYLNACHCLIAPYQKTIHIEGSTNTIENWISPLKLFEYMAASKPIICSDLPVIREVLKHETNALMCPSDDFEAWKNALLKLKLDKELQERLSQNALNDLKTKYTWDKRAEKILNFIQH